MLSIRAAKEEDIPEIERMVLDFVKDHPAKDHPRSREALRRAYFDERPVAHLLLAQRDGDIAGMVQWHLIHDMFWGFFGVEAAWLYVRPQFRGSGIVAALLARVCADARADGAQFMHGGGGDGPQRLYERVAIGSEGRECHVSGKAFDVFAGLHGLPPRDIIRRLPSREMSLQPADA
jgi:N-acetylglutamate synthase-like GNAT family acetyltransferase